LDFKGIIENKFSLLDSVKIYKDMALEMFIPILKTSAISIIFIFCAQAAFSLMTYNSILNVFFGAVVFLILCVAMSSFFKTAEDIILDKTAQVYSSISHVLSLSLKLFAVLGMILGAIGVLILPVFYIKHLLFILPYTVIVSIFIIACIPFVFFAPLAVVLRDASIKKSFIFSYYMTLERWNEISKAILIQFAFVAIIAFWAYFVVSLLFFPNTSDFFGFLSHQAVALSEQSRNLYVRFVLWEMAQIFVFLMVSGIFIGNNTILFAYLDDSLSKIMKRKEEIKVNNKVSSVNAGVKYVDILRHSKPVVIKPEEDEEKIAKKKQEHDDYYQDDALNSEFVPQEPKKTSPKK
nr:hypothetical protein [Elusimicrobiaceae bacterium]